MRSVFVPWSVALGESERLLDDLSRYTKVDGIELLDFSSQIEKASYGSAQRPASRVLPSSKRLGLDLPIVKRGGLQGGTEVHERRDLEGVQDHLQLRSAVARDREAQRVFPGRRDRQALGGTRRLPGLRLPERPRHEKVRGVHDARVREVVARHGDNGPQPPRVPPHPPLGVSSGRPREHVRLLLQVLRGCRARARPRPGEDEERGQAPPRHDGRGAPAGRKGAPPP